MFAAVLVVSVFQPELNAESAKPIRCEVVPQAGHQVSFRIDGREKLRWHHGNQYPRPFCFPLNGPSGQSLTRMGHPGAPNHDHHRSVWFAHSQVNGLDFWSDNTQAQIRQKQWLAYHSGSDEAVMACLLGWFDADGNEVLEQETVVAVRPVGDSEHAVEFQLTLRPPRGVESVELQQTNFGILAVRVAAGISEHFGSGRLTSSAGLVGEPAIFGTKAKWMDYSGAVTVGTGADRAVIVEGLTYHDHPDNPDYPSGWHVRADGWMGASLCRFESRTVTASQPLRLRYLLHAHHGACEAGKSHQLHTAFAKRPGFLVERSKRPHRHSEVHRISLAPSGDLRP